MRRPGVLAVPEFRRLLLALLPALLGDSTLLLVFAIWVKSLTDSDAAAGLVILCVAAPSLASPLLGFLADRVPRRPFLIGIRTVTAVALLLLLAVEGPDDVWLIYILAAVYGATSMLGAGAMAGLLKTMLPAESLAPANSLLQTSRQVFRLTAPLVGAAAYAALGGHPVVIAVAALYVATAVGLLTLRIVEVRRPRAAEPLLREITAGIRYLFGSPDLRRIVLTLGIAILFIGGLEPAYFAVIDTGLHRPPAFMGVLMAIEGGGAVIGALMAPRLIRRWGEPRTIAAGALLMGASVLLLIPPSLPSVIVGSVALGAGNPVLVVAWATLLQRRTPHQLMARVNSAADVVINGPMTLSIGFGAVLLGVVDYRMLLLTAAAALLICGLALVISRSRPIAEIQIAAGDRNQALDLP